MYDKIKEIWKIENWKKTKIRGYFKNRGKLKIGAKFKIMEKLKKLKTSDRRTNLNREQKPAIGQISFEDNYGKKSPYFPED